METQNKVILKQKPTVNDKKAHARKEVEKKKRRRKKDSGHSYSLTEAI